MFFSLSIVAVLVFHIIISFSSSHATSITQVMTSAETQMEWTSSAGTKFCASLLTYCDMKIHNRGKMNYNIEDMTEHLKT